MHLEVEELNSYLEEILSYALEGEIDSRAKLVFTSKRAVLLANNLLERCNTPPGNEVTKTILTSNTNSSILVDAEDYPLLSRYTWTKHPNDMVETRVDGHKIYIHRMIVNPFSNKVIDHINGNRLDNRKVNLRVCGSNENCMNLSPRLRTTSKYKGVSWNKRDKKWISYIRHNQKRVALGYYDCEVDAARAYNCAALKYFGEFAKINKF